MTARPQHTPRVGSARWLREHDPELAQRFLPLLAEVREQVVSVLTGSRPEPDSVELAEWKREFAIAKARGEDK